ncbi:MAG: ATP synthase subunit I [Acidimicrobiia bacterium]|jgi:F1F0 ATPase subunit 2
MIADIGIGLAVGLIAGVVFFGGLRWTLDRLATARRPLLLTVASFMLRGVAVAGLLVLVSEGVLARVLAGLAGILVVRTVMVARVRREFEAEESSWT